MPIMTTIFTFLQAVPTPDVDGGWVAAAGVLSMIIHKLGAAWLDHRKQRHEAAAAEQKRKDVEEAAERKAERRKAEAKEQRKLEKEEREAWEAAAIRVAVEATTATMQSMIDSAGNPECVQHTVHALKESEYEFKTHLNSLAIRDAKREGADRLVSDILEGQARLTRSLAPVEAGMVRLQKTVDTLLGELERKRDA